MADVPLSVDVPRIYVPSFSVPEIKPQHINVPKLRLPGAPYRVPEVDKTRRHLESISQALLLGNPISGTRQLRETLEDHNLDMVKYVPVINRLVGAGLYFKERTIDPVTEGKPGVALINNIESLGYDLDILANPVKSLMPWAGGGKAPDFLKSMGWIDNEYQEAYQWDTGNFIVDYIGEMFSDPLNWIPVVSAQGPTDELILVAKNEIKKLNATGNIDNIPDSTIKRIIEYVSDVLIDSSDDTARKMINRIERNRADLLKSVEGLSPNAAQTKLVNEIIKDYDAVNLLRKDYDLADIVSSVRNADGFKKYATLKSLNKFKDVADKNIARMAFAGAPLLGGSIQFFKYAAVPGFQHLWNKATLELDKLDPNEILNQGPAKLHSIKHSLTRSNKMFNTDVFDKFKDILKTYNLDVDKLVAMYIQLYKETPPSRFNKLDLDKRFLAKLEQAIPDLRKFHRYKAVQEGEARLLNAIRPEDIANLVDAIASEGIILVAVEQQLKKQYKDFINKDIEYFFTARGKNIAAGKDISEYAFDDILKYLNKRLFKINGKQYKLTQLEKYLYDLNQVDPEAYAYMTALLNYIGITANNYKQILRLYSSRNYKGIKDLLKQSKLDLVYTSKSAEASSKSIIKNIKYTALDMSRGDKEGTARILEFFKSSNDATVEEIENQFKNMVNTDQIRQLQKDIRAAIDYVEGYELTAHQLNRELKDINKITKRFEIYFQYLSKDNPIGNKKTKTKIESAIKVIQQSTNKKELEASLQTLRDCLHDWFELEAPLFKTATDETKVMLDSMASIDKDLFRKSVYLDSLGKPTTFFEELDAMFDYAGGQVGVIQTNSEFLKNILDIDPEDLTPENLAVLKEALEGLESKSYLWATQVKEGSTRAVLSADTKTKIFQLRDLVTRYTKSGMRANLNDLLNAQEDYYYLIMSAEARYLTLVRSIMSGSDALTTFINDASDLSENNKLRVNLQHLCSILQRSETLGYEADYTRNILTKIDSMNCINLFLDTKLTDMEIPKDVQDYLRGMMFNLIHEQRNTFAADLNSADRIRSLVKRFMSQFQRDCKQELYEYYEKKAPKELVDDVMLEDYQRLKKKFINGTLTDEEYDLYEEYRELGDALLQKDLHQSPLLEYDALIDEVEESITEALTTYIEQLCVISKINLTDATLFNPLDGKSVAQMVDLGVNRKEIVAALAELNVEDAAIADVDRFISGIAGNSLDTSAKLNNEMIEDIVNNSAFYDDVEINFKNPKKTAKNELDKIDKAMENTNVFMMEDSLAKAITESFAQINKINADLSGASVVGKIVDENGVTKVKSFVYYVNVDKVNAYIRSTSNKRNAYDFSTTNGMISFKKGIKADFIAQHKLTSTFLRKTDSITTAKFLSCFQLSAQRVSRYIVKNTEAIKIKRQALINLFADPTISFGPKDAALYFATVSDEDVLIWDLVVRNRNFNLNLRQKYKDDCHTIYRTIHPAGTTDKAAIDYTRRADYYMDPASVYEELDAVTSVTPVADTNRLEQLYESLPTEFLDDITAGVEEDLSRHFKDPASLKCARGTYATQIKQDVDAFNNTKVLNELSQDTRTVAQVVHNKKQLATLQAFGIRSDTLMNDERVLKFLMRERNMSLTQSIKRWNAKQLRSFIDKNTDGSLIVALEDATGFFKYSPEDLKDAGIIISELSDSPGTFVIRRTAEKKVFTPYEYVAYESIFPKQQQVITDLFKKNRGYFNFEGMDLPDELFTGQMMNDTQLEIIKDHKSIKAGLGSIDEQNNYTKVDNKGRNTFYTAKYSRPNLQIVGDYNAMNKVLDLCEEDFKVRGMTAYRSTNNLVHSAWRGNLESIQRVNSMYKYLQMFWNDDYFIGNAMFKPVLEKATDKELKDLFSNGVYDAVIIRKSKSGKPKAYKIYITNQKQLHDAIDAGAIMLPHEVYRNLVLTVNKEKINNKLLKMYRKTIVGTFKSMYLTSTGYLMRNYLDSAIYKNNNSYRGIAGMFDMFKYEYKAAKMIKWHNEIQSQVFKQSGGKSFNRKYLRRVLASLTEEERKSYMVVDMFLNSAASGGLSKSFEEFLLKYNVDNADFIGYAWEKYYNEYVLDNPVFAAVRDANSVIEQSSRFGLFLALADQGGSYADIIKKVIDTHFDYELKEGGIGLLEQLFWFSTFPINNLAYYINGGLTDHPEMLKATIDALELSYNDGDNYTWDDVRNSNYLTYNALAGNIRLYLAGNTKDDPTSRLILKTGSSVLDFFNVVCNPLGEAKERLNPFLSVLFGWENPDQLLPWTSTVNNAKKIIEGRSYLPSVYATLYPKKEYNNHYIRKEPYVPYARYHRKPRAYFPKNYKFHRYARTVYPYRIQLKPVTMRWLTMTQGKTSGFYDKYYKLHKANAMYRRQIRKLELPSEPFK